MYTVEDICTTAMQLAGRGDKPSSDDMALAIRTLKIILEDWTATRGVILWNLIESSLDILRGDVVQVGEDYYQCYLTHTSEADNEPGVGDNWQNYWVLCKPATAPLTWALTNVYENRRATTIQSTKIEDLLAVRLQCQGQISPVEKIRTMDFTDLPLADIGYPDRMLVQKTQAGLVVHLHPLPDIEEAKLLYYVVQKPDEWEAGDITTLAGQWVQALYYALAVELGFLWHIELNRMDLLGKKAEYEFNKAFRTNESEIDECYIKPAY